MLFSPFTSSRPATLFADNNSSCRDSGENLTNDLSGSNLAYDSDGDTLVDDKLDSNSDYQTKDYLLRRYRPLSITKSCQSGARYFYVGEMLGLNAIKRTRPEAHPIATVCFLTIERRGRYSGGSQRILLPFQVIQDLSTCTQYADQFGVRRGSEED